MPNEDRARRLKVLEDFVFNVDKIVKQPVPVSADEQSRRRNVEEKQVDKLMLELILLHKESVKVDERDFLDLLKHSFSLNTMEKKRVLDAVPVLSQFQFDELTKVWVEERERFKQLAKEHPDDIKALLQKRQTEWLQLGDLYKWEKENKGTVSVEGFWGRLRGGGKGPAMVVLPTGSFRMGDLDGYLNYKQPVRTVTISRRIAMGQYPVTFEDYDLYVSVMGAERPADEGWGRGRRPVINVSWYEAKAYAVWLSEQTNKRYRLPSESEWEYAARAGTETAYSWGDEIGVNQANGRDSGSKWGGRQTSPVGSFEPNAFGLYDMHGNVDEWVEDCMFNDYVKVFNNYKGAPSDGSA